MPHVGKQHIHALPANDVRILNQYAQYLRLDIAAKSECSLPLINLLIGEPDFPTPEHIKFAAIEAIQQHAIGYGPSGGWILLKEQIADKVQRVNAYQISEDNVAVTMGGTGAIQAAFTAILREGDDVLVPDPGWPQYQLQLACCGANAIHYNLDQYNNWLPNLRQIEQLLTPRSRILVINSPANPGGTVFPPQLIEQLLSFAQRHNLYLLSDECYDEIVFDGSHISPATFLSSQEFEQGHIICIYTFSKTYAMTGWRIGYLVSSKELVRTVTHVLDSNYTNISTIVQHAASAALQGSQVCVQTMRTAYHQRRDCAIAMLKDFNRYTYTPQGAFYILVDISHPNAPERQSNVFARTLLQKRHVAVAPGTSFGQVVPHMVRISLAAAEQDIARGIRELCTFADSYDSK